MALREIGEEWLEFKRKIVKHSTWCAYLLIFRKHLLPKFGECEAVSEDEAQNFLFSLLQGGMGKKTVREVLATLKNILRYAAKRHGWPSVEWDLEYPRTNPGDRLPVLSVRNQRRLMRYLVNEPSAKSIGILISLCTGMRIGEVLGLRWKDIDLRQRVITVSRTVGRGYNIDSRKTEIVVSSPKTRNSHREIPIPGVLYGVLRKVHGLHPMAEYVVGGRRSHVEPRAYRDYFKRLLRRLGIPQIVFHGLRHTFATRCIQAGCDPKTLSTILGHSTVATTLNLYVHPDILQKKQCMNKYQKFLGMDGSYQEEAIQEEIIAS